jgi:hypothetical protein
MSVQVGATTAYEPDVMIRCGAPVDDEATRIHGPIVIVEVPSPSTRGVDTGDRLVDCFRLPGLRHDILVRTHDNRMVRCRRGTGDTIDTGIHAAGPVTLDPPGPTVDLSA